MKMQKGQETEMTAAPVVLTAEMARRIVDKAFELLTAEECRALEARASGAVVCRVADEWQPMNTVPECDDELWFCRGDTFEGPRAPRMDDVDYWDWWCYAVPPPLPAPPKE